MKKLYEVKEIGTINSREKVMEATRKAMQEWKEKHVEDEFANMDARLEYINSRVMELTTEETREAAETGEDATEEAETEETTAPAEEQPTPTNEAPQAAPQAAEGTTITDEKKEEVTPMSNTIERYDYLEHMTADVIDAIRERYTDDEIRSRLDDDRDELAQELNDDLWTDDSVTGNASGSYYCNAWRAEDAIAHNWDLIADMIDEFDAADILRKGPEAIDVSIRCYLLGQAIDAALDQLDDEIPEAEEIDDEEEEAR